IAEGLALITRTLGTVPIGPYQLQAAIAAVHDEARPPARRTGRRSSRCTKCSPRWRPDRWSPSAARSPWPWCTARRPGSPCSASSTRTTRMTHTHRLDAVRAHLLERAGDTVAARESYLRAARMTASVPEQRYLALRAARLHQLAPPADPAGCPDRSADAGGGP